MTADDYLLDSDDELISSGFRMSLGIPPRTALPALEQARPRRGDVIARDCELRTWPEPLTVVVTLQ